MAGNAYSGKRYTCVFCGQRRGLIIGTPRLAATVHSTIRNSPSEPMAGETHDIRKVEMGSSFPSAPWGEGATLKPKVEGRPGGPTIAFLRQGQLGIRVDSDPNTWSWLEEEHEYRLYLDPQLSQWAVLDYVDYAWAIQWCWRIKPSRGKRKWYAVRSTTFGGCKIMLYLHVEIMKRTGIKRPERWETVITDHRDGDSMNCRRENL